MSNPTNDIYSLRKKFSIIGLTGKMGSGCTIISDFFKLSNEEFIKRKGALYRDHKKISLLEKDERNINFSVNLFKRKYSICSRFIEKNRIPYETIDYKKALILYSLLHITSNKLSINNFYELIESLFSKGKEDKEVELASEKINLKNLQDKIDSPLRKVYDELKNIKSNFLELKDEEELKKLEFIFFNDKSPFNEVYHGLMKEMYDTHYYLRTFFFHKLANNIRSTGAPFKDGEISNSNIYCVARFINRLIKAYKLQHSSCHIIIDSLKNSLEIMFFKERYSAFYLISVHHEEGYRDRIKSKTAHMKEKQDLCVKKLIELDSIEYASNDFRKGLFYAPDVQNCIQKAEIHINYNEKLDEAVYEFHTIAEQIIKIQSLILQPGIITPSNIERCMQIAYNSKFNSGCISRQVGAVVTDSTFAIKSVGWNDVPKNTISCLFRNVDEIMQKKSDELDKAYSEFELNQSNFTYQPKIVGTEKEEINKDYIGGNFATNLTKKYTGKLNQLNTDGKNCQIGRASC